MAEQIQSMLNDLDHKFQSSFTLEQSSERQDKLQNPQKLEVKHLDELNFTQQQINRQNYQKYKQIEHSQDDLLRQEFLKQIQQINEDFSSQANTPQKVLKQFNNKNHQHQNNYQEYQMSNYNLEKNPFTHQQQDLQRENDSYHRYNSQRPFSPCNQDGNSQQFSYKQLTLKLQKALQKISSQKKITSKLGGTTMYQRFQQYQKRKIKQIQKRREQKQQEQINQIRDKPMINSNSRSMFVGMKEQPLFERYDKIIEQKKKKQLQYQTIRKQKQDKQYEEYLKEYNDHKEKIAKKYQETGIRSNQEYFQQMARWQQKKQESILNQKNQKQEKQKQELIFKPQINKKSQNLMKKSDRVPIYEREVKISIVQDEHCTFKPKINKVNMHKKYSYY